MRYDVLEIVHLHLLHTVDSRDSISLAKIQADKSDPCLALDKRSIKIYIYIYFFFNS